MRLVKSKKRKSDAEPPAPAVEVEAAPPPEVSAPPPPSAEELIADAIPEPDWPSDLTAVPPAEPLSDEPVFVAPDAAPGADDASLEDQLAAAAQRITALEAELTAGRQWVEEYKSATSDRFAGLAMEYTERAGRLRAEYEEQYARATQSFTERVAAIEAAFNQQLATVKDDYESKLALAQTALADTKKAHDADREWAQSTLTARVNEIESERDAATDRALRAEVALMQLTTEHTKLVETQAKLRKAKLWQIARQGALPVGAGPRREPTPRIYVLGETAEDAISAARAGGVAEVTSLTIVSPTVLIPE